MRNAIGSLGAFVLCVGSAFGCGDDDDGAYSGGPVEKSDLPRVVAQVVCGAIEPCCKERSVPFDEAACRSTFSAAFRDSISSADPAKYTYYPDRAADCLSALQESSDACSDEAMASMQSDLCQDAFVGKVAPGDPCASAVECKAPADGDVSCERNGSGGSEVCVSEATAQEGEPCYWTCTQRGTARTCTGGSSAIDVTERPRCFTNDGLFCSSAGTCEAQADEGEACMGFASCLEGLFCDPATVMCRTPLQEGDPCSAQGCDEGLFCHEGECLPWIATGESCEPFVDECEGGGSCSNSGICPESGDIGDLGLVLVCGLAGG